MDGTQPEQIVIETDKAWYLYVGEIKAAGLNRLLNGALAGRYGKTARCIHIVPDVLSHYPPGHFLVVNPDTGSPGSGLDHPRSVRLPAAVFAAHVSADIRVIELVRQILEVQGEVLVSVFESRKELVMGDFVTVIGPDPILAEEINNKLNQREIASGLGLSLPDGGVFHDRDGAMEYAATVFDGGGLVFVSGAYSAGGSNSIIASSINQVEGKFDESDGVLLVTEYIEHDYDPTVLGIVAGEREVYIASTADQDIRGTRFTGSMFPTVLNGDTVFRLKEMTRTVGYHLGTMGYRGCFGCDFIVDRSGQIFFIEINARKQGTTMETALTMKRKLPEHPSFPELEMSAVLDGSFPDGVTEMDSTEGPIFWGTYNYKAETDLAVEGYVPPVLDEEELFTKAESGKAGYIVVEHVGPDTSIAAGGFLARVISVGGSREEVLEGLSRGKEEIRQSLRTGS